ncbi:MAG: FecR family protein [Phocaeicola sp.]
MKRLEDKCLEFVLKHYKPNCLNTQRAYQRFLKTHQLSPRPTHILPLPLLKAIALFALVMLPLGVYLYLQPAGKWVEIASNNQVIECMLPDSTFVTLAPHATLRYHTALYQKEERNVEIAGKAFFNVKRDAKHPFIVRDQIAQVKVLGTQFLLHAFPHHTELTVESGSVLFAAKDQEQGVILTQGMHAELQDDEALPRIVANSTPNKMTWRTGLFQYDRTPLLLVLEELSDYYQVKLSTPSEDSAKRELTGTFSDKNLDEIIEVIERVLAIQIVKEPSSEENRR